MSKLLELLLGQLLDGLGLLFISTFGHTASQLRWSVTVLKKIRKISNKVYAGMRLV